MADLTTILIDQKEELGEMETGGLVPRKEEELVNLKSNVAQVVIGVRRSGKSTLQTGDTTVRAAVRICQL